MNGAIATLLNNKRHATAQTANNEPASVLLQCLLVDVVPNDVLRCICAYATAPSSVARMETACAVAATCRKLRDIVGAGAVWRQMQWIVEVHKSAEERLVDAMSRVLAIMVRRTTVSEFRWTVDLTDGKFHIGYGPNDALAISIDVQQRRVLVKRSIAPRNVKRLLHRILRLQTTRVDYDAIVTVVNDKADLTANDSDSEYDDVDGTDPNLDLSDDARCMFIKFVDDTWFSRIVTNWAFARHILLPVVRHAMDSGWFSASPSRVRWKPHMTLSHAAFLQFTRITRLQNAPDQHYELPLDDLFAAFDEQRRRTGAAEEGDGGLQPITIFDDESDEDDRRRGGDSDSDDGYYDDSDRGSHDDAEYDDLLHYHPR